MSRTPFAPDPSKWMSANKVDRSAQKQRPLIDPRFRAHVGIPTPPPSTARRKPTTSNSTPTPAAGGRNASSSTPSSSLKKKVGRKNDATPAKDGGIANYFTPPMSSAREAVGKGKTAVSRLREREEASTRGSPLARNTDYHDVENFNVAGTSTPGSSTARPIPSSKIDDDAAKFFAEMERKKPVSSPRSHTPDVIDLSSPSPELDPAVCKRRSAIDSVTPPPAPPIISSTYIRPSNVIASLRHTSPRPSSCVASPLSTPHRPFPESSSPYTERHATQVPADIVRQHRRLCGHESTKKRVKHGPDENNLDEEAKLRKREEEKVRRREKIAEKEEVAHRAISASREKVVLGKRHRSLVHLSSSSGGDRSSSPHAPGKGEGEATPLAALQTNVVPLRRYASEFDPRSRKSAADEHQEFRPTKPFSPIRGAARKFTVFEDDADVAPLLPTPKKRAVPPLPPSSPPRSPVRSPPIASAMPTPRKPRSPHHKVTPPKSRSPRFGANQETLFEFLPAPPPQPVFQSKAEEEVKEEVKRADWEPLDMQPETLMTWSLGPRAETLLQKSVASVVDALELAEHGEEEEHSEEIPQIDQFSPSPKKRNRSSDELRSDDLGQTPRSQSFPHLVNSSPSKINRPSTKHVAFATTDSESRSHSRSNPTGEPEPEADSEERVLIPETLGTGLRMPQSRGITRQFSDFAPESVITSPAKKLVRRAGQQPARDLDHALFSSITDDSLALPPASSRSARRQAATNQPSQSSASQSQKRKTPTASQKPRTRSQRSSQAKPDPQQSKLEVFGYFPESKRRESRGFETAFEDEEDLAFENEAEEEVGETPVRSSERGLGPVPAPPPHPSLRPAGIRELRRREREAEARKQSKMASTPSSSSMSVPSSIQRQSPRLLQRRRQQEQESTQSSSPSKQAAPSTDATTDLSSSLMTIGHAGGHADEAAREWWDAIDHRRSDEFESLS